MPPTGLSRFVGLARAVSGVRSIKNLLPTLPRKFYPAFNDKDFVKGVRALEHDIAKRFHSQLTRNFRSNAFGYSLPEKTISRKKGANRSVPLIDTGDLVKNGIVLEGARVFVKDGKHRSSRVTYAELAAIHEYGRRDKHIPARPVWRRTFTAFEPVAKKMVTNFLYPKGFRR